MNGLNYILFVTETKHTDIASQLEVTPQMVNAWVKESKPIASKHLPKLVSHFGVADEYFQKSLTLQDRIEIEMQLASKTGKYENIEYQATVLHKQNQAMKEKYMALLNGIQEYATAFETIEKHAKDIQKELTLVVQIPSIADCPSACESLYGLLTDLQAIRKLSK
ncbi:hypothetical protein [Bacillus thuringiensis]|uniref:hypothetical protein n=1 Tax=Bacillus thuringiensis TaxID=1428 RepID=UPI000BFB638D|nr:hypothetical protein [Bacillus thuringiensis]PGT89887.1 hypothetical protein COD17_09050 [Bacillus thuringiensis]